MQCGRVVPVPRGSVVAGSASVPLGGKEPRSQALPICSPSPHSPLVQFNLLHSKFHLCSVPTRALLLSTYIKFVNLFPEVKPTIQDVLRSDSQLKNADVELQQRAVEYLRLSTVASTDILVGRPGCTGSARS